MELIDLFMRKKSPSCQADKATPALVIDSIIFCKTELVCLGISTCYSVSKYRSASRVFSSLISYGSIILILKRSSGSLASGEIAAVSLKATLRVKLVLSIDFKL